MFGFGASPVVEAGLGFTPFAGVARCSSGLRVFGQFGAARSGRFGARFGGFPAMRSHCGFSPGFRWRLPHWWALICLFWGCSSRLGLAHCRASMVF